MVVTIGSRFLLFGMALALLALPACDSNEDGSNEFTITISMEGSGSGRIVNTSIFVEIDCRVTDGVVSGECDDVFINPDGEGVVRILAQPEVNTNFSWGTPCQSSTGNLCEIEFDAETQGPIDVSAVFEAKTKNVTMDPPSANITTGGQEGHVIVTARAVDDRGAVVPGVTYVWDIDRPDIASISPQTAESVKVVATASGQVVVSATAQGVVGRTPIDIRLTN